MCGTYDCEEGNAHDRPTGDMNGADDDKQKSICLLHRLIAWHRAEESAKKEMMRRSTPKPAVGERERKRIEIICGKYKQV